MLGGHPFAVEDAAAGAAASEVEAEARNIFTILIPAIVCDSCVQVLKSALTPYLPNRDEQYLKISSLSQQATITVSSEIQLETLLAVIKEAGYGEPEPTLALVQSFSRSKRKQCDTQRGRGNNCSLRDLLVPEIKYGEAITHHFRISTARTPDCLGGIETLFAQFDLGSSSDPEMGVISVTSDSGIPVSDIQAAIQSTGHVAELIDNPPAAEENLGNKRRAGLRKGF